MVGKTIFSDTCYALLTNGRLEAVPGAFALEMCTIVATMLGESLDLQTLLGQIERINDCFGHQTGNGTVQQRYQRRQLTVVENRI